MSIRSDRPCWEIMECNPDDVTTQRCPAYKANKPCWEIKREIDEYLFNICKDCIVYISKKTDDSRWKEISAILCQKGIDLTGARCPNLKKLKPRK